MERPPYSRVGSTPGDRRNKKAHRVGWIQTGSGSGRSCEEDEYDQNEILWNFQRIGKITVSKRVHYMQEIFQLILINNTKGDLVP